MHITIKYLENRWALHIDYGMSRLFLGIPLKVRIKDQSKISENVHSAIFYLQAWEQYTYKHFLWTILQTFPTCKIYKEQKNRSSVEVAKIAKSIALPCSETLSKDNLWYEARKTLDSHINKIVNHGTSREQCGLQE